jgi:hypothetical protein
MQVLGITVESLLFSSLEKSPPRPSEEKFCNIARQL